VATESINGTTVENIKEVGKKTICTEKEFIPGLTKEDMMDSTKTIRSMGSALIHIQMVDHTEAIGRTVNRMDKESLQHLLEKPEKEYGKMVREKDGLIMTMMNEVEFKL